ncbi:hypothetical protein RRG08_032128 [Elysia crispata]|uniref:Uncharacterized protein n=1 Tax=Elysia crispata TaxID=231223 RepID=A0AAE0ZDI2_9GAST|nr:hypothetical protein RRG08_032128 [Elysia crispata]
MWQRLPEREKHYTSKETCSGASVSVYILIATHGNRLHRSSTARTVQHHGKTDLLVPGRLSRLLASALQIFRRSALVDEGTTKDKPKQKIMA